MTLSEFNSKFYSRPSVIPPTTIYFFEDEDSADAWIEATYFDGSMSDYELTGVLRSDMVAQYTLKPEWCNAELQQFYAVEPDVIVAVVRKMEVEHE